jgi:hypothetical protein
MEYFADLWTFAALYATVTMLVIFLTEDPHRA